MIRFVKMSVEPWGMARPNEAETLKLIERAGRTAYKSEDKITEDSAEKFVSHLKGLGHLSVLEHSNIVLDTESTGNGFIPLAYATFEHRAAFHRFTQFGGRVYLSGNIRAWLETLPFLLRRYKYDEGAYIEALDFWLSRFFPTLFEKSIDLDEDDIQKAFSLTHPDDQLRILRKDPDTDLPIFIFKIVCDRDI